MGPGSFHHGAPPPEKPRRLRRARPSKPELNRFPFSRSNLTSLREFVGLDWSLDAMRAPQLIQACFFLPQLAGPGNRGRANRRHASEKYSEVFTGALIKATGGETSGPPAQKREKLKKPKIN